MHDDPDLSPRKNELNEIDVDQPKTQPKGQRLFWWLLFSPAVLMIIGFIPTARDFDEAVLFMLSMGVGFIICVYCGYWTARGWSKTTGALVVGTILMALAYSLMNLIVAFAGCMMVFNI